MKRAIWAVPVVAAIVLLLGYGFGKNPSAVPAPLVRHQAPAFKLKSTAGRPIQLVHLAGRPVLLNFFASWCLSCKEQEANLVNAYRKWSRRVSFLGVVFEDSPTAAAGFTRSHGGQWPDLIDPGGQTAVNYGVTGVPETFYIDRRGRIVDHSVSLTPASIRTGIKRILGRG